MRKFYKLEPKFGLFGKAPTDFINDAACAPPRGSRTGKYVGKHEFGVGIVPYEETPVLKFRTELKRLPDIDFLGDIMYFSDAARQVLSSVDPEAFEWLQVDSVQGKGVPSKAPYWFGDVIRILDCVDEEQSDIVYYDKVDWDPELVRYRRAQHLVMKPDMPADHHIFRPAKQSGWIIVDDIFRNAVLSAKLLGADFKEIGIG